MRFQFNDGGRSSSGFKGETGDCMCRAIAIATGLPYRFVYDELNSYAKTLPVPKRQRDNGSARTGVTRNVYDRMLADLGFRWHPLMRIGSGTTVHMREDELPSGTIICRMSKHVATVIDGVLHDTYDCTRGGTRAVYGYWRRDAT